MEHCDVLLDAALAGSKGAGSAAEGVDVRAAAARALCVGSGLDGVELGDFLSEVFAVAPAKLGVWTARILDAGERATPPLNVTLAEALIMYALNFDPPQPSSRSFAPAVIQATRDAPRLGTTAPLSDPLLNATHFLQRVYAELPREVRNRLNMRIVERVGPADRRRLTGLG